MRHYKIYNCIDRFRRIHLAYHLKFTISFLLFLTGLMQAQPPTPEENISGDIKVTQMTFEEILTEDDELESGFGRFDVFEVFFHAGDRILIDLSSDEFAPALALISPEEKDFMALPKAGQNSVTHAMTIPTTGDWLLIVRGDSLALGRYFLSCWWAQAESLQLPEEADLCDQINFIFGHANADFFFLKKSQLLGSRKDVWQPSMELEGAIYSEIRSPGQERYVARMYSGSNKDKARDVYSGLVARLKFCNNDKWPGTFKDWYDFDVMNGLQKMEFQINEDERDDYRFVRIEVIDYSGSLNQFSQKYAVDVVIGRFRPEDAK